MKASELRIGNLVQMWGEVITIQTVGKRNVLATTPKAGEVALSLDQLQPIPLTEEWLIRFGFEEHYMGHRLIIWERGDSIRQLVVTDYYLYLTEEGAEIDEITTLWDKDFVMKEFYVHELQNLFASITRQELVLKDGEA